MIPRADSRLGRVMAAFAAVLLAVLVVQSPVATVDRLLHDMGRSHAANTFAGVLVDLPEHDHNQGQAHGGAQHDDHDGAPGVQAAGDDPSPDPAAPGPHHHHHHDGASVYGMAGSPSLPVAWSSSALPFRMEDDLRKGVDAFRQDRPPKARLDHVA